MEKQFLASIHVQNTQRRNQQKLDHVKLKKQPPEYSLRKGAFKKFRKTRKETHLPSLFFNKVAGLSLEYLRTCF